MWREVRLCARACLPAVKGYEGMGNLHISWIGGVRRACLLHAGATQESGPHCVVEGQREAIILLYWDKENYVHLLT